MAINWTNLFENLGEYVERVNESSTIITNLGSQFLELEADLVSNSMFNIFEGEHDRFEQYKAQILGWIDGHKQKIVELFTDKTTIRDELNNLGDTSDFESVIVEVFEAMNAATEYITPNAVTLGAVTDSKTNANAGSIITSKVLDGVSAPSPGWPVVPGYDGLDSEMALSDNMAIICTGDSERDGYSEGAEQFKWVGDPNPGHPYSWEEYGAGDGPTLTPIQGASLMSNLEFESFTTTDTPDDWTVDAGTVTTHIFDETTAADIKRGSHALQFTGDAAQASIQISQDLPDGIVPKKRYAVGFWIKGQAGTSAGTLTIQFEGTGYTAASSEKIELNAAALAAQTSYEWEYFWINMPAEIPDDMELVIKWTGTPSAHSVRIDGGGMCEATYFNGHCAFVYAGSDPFIRRDKFTYNVTNDYAGVFQTAFAKLLGIQMPSDAVPTQADSLAT